MPRQPLECETGAGAGGKTCSGPASDRTDVLSTSGVVELRSNSPVAGAGDEARSDGVTTGIWDPPTISRDDRASAAGQRQRVTADATAGARQRNGSFLYMYLFRIQIRCAVEPSALPPPGRDHLGLLLLWLAGRRSRPSGIDDRTPAIRPNRMPSAAVFEAGVRDTINRHPTQFERAVHVARRSRESHPFRRRRYKRRRRPSQALARADAGRRDARAAGSVAGRTRIHSAEGSRYRFDPLRRATG